MGKKIDILAEIGQWFTAAIVLAGILAEIKYKADVCFTAITTGTFLWAVVQKVKHPSRKKRRK